MPAKRYTKTEIKKMLVEERKKSRTKHQQSVFVNRTRGMYNGQVNRYVELREKSKTSFPYTLEQFREKCTTALDKPTCWYCDKKLTVKSMCADHRLPVVRGGSFKLSNIRIIHQNCNWRKGLMTEAEYEKLTTFADFHLSGKARADLWKRLGIGGRWAPR